MATRATVSIEGVGFAKVYKHWYGYPEGMLPFLEKFNKDFTKERGVDPEYKLAQLLRESVRSQKEFDLDRSKYTGWGVTSYNQEEEYNYVLHADGSVTYTESD